MFYPLLYRQKNHLNYINIVTWTSIVEWWKDPLFGNRCGHLYLDFVGWSWLTVTDVMNITSYFTNLQKEITIIKNHQMHLHVSQCYLAKEMTVQHRDTCIPNALCWSSWKYTVLVLTYALLFFLPAQVSLHMLLHL